MNSDDAILWSLAGVQVLAILVTSVALTMRVTRRKKPAPFRAAFMCGICRCWPCHCEARR